MTHPELTRASRVDRKREATRQKIVSVATELFHQRGFEATTMEQIAETVDIAKGTLYTYFPVKEAILSEYIQRAFTEKNPDRIVRLHSLPDTRARMLLILGDLLAGVRAQTEIFEKFLVYRVQSILSLHKTESQKSGIELLAAEIIALGQASGEIRTDLPSSILEDQFEFIFIEAVKQFTLQPESFNPDTVIESCVDLFLNGMRKEGR